MSHLGDTVTITCAGCGTEFEWAVTSGRRRKWCSERCRKSQYDRACESCGARLSGTDPGKTKTELCGACFYERHNAEQRAHIIAEMQRWARLFGDAPAAYEWHPDQVRRIEEIKIADDETIRVGRFTIRKSKVPSRSVSFETKPTLRLTIGVAKDE